MNISKNKVNFNKKRIIILIIYILAAIIANYLVVHSSINPKDRMAYFGGFVIGSVIRWTFLIVFFLMNENLVSRLENWKRKGIRFASILLVVIVFNSFVHPFSFAFDYFVTWLILNKGIRAEKTSEKSF